ncbi:MAG TPA: transglutaminase-like domain-containing protein [Longimicrobiales bacterium]|nr:transglutaminase-like domain-containing protein [Longimicrobiales bacterium]
MSTAPAPAPRSRFAAVVGQQETEVDLALAALLIAAEEYPQLVPEPYLRRIDLLAERVRDRLGEETAPLVVLQELSRVLFEEEGFRGNAEAYYDPRNSFLNDVLDRRVGVPLTLSLLYLEVGWRLGLPLHGVNFPGHFLVRYDGEALKLLIDPFQRGEIRFEDEAQALLDRVYGGTVSLQPSYLRPADRKDILVRLLSNLKGIYLNTRDDRRALAATERILLVRPDAAEEVRDRGMLLARLGFADDAVQELRDYLARAPGADDADRVRLLIRELGGSEQE